MKGAEHVSLQEIELIVYFLVHYRSGSHIMHSRIQHTRLEGFTVLLIYLV